MRAVRRVSLRMPGLIVRLGVGVGMSLAEKSWACGGRVTRFLAPFLLLVPFLLPSRMHALVTI